MHPVALLPIHPLDIHLFALPIHLLSPRLLTSYSNRAGAGASGVPEQSRPATCAALACTVVSGCARQRCRLAAHAACKPSSCTQQQEKAMMMLCESKGERGVTFCARLDMSRITQQQRDVGMLCVSEREKRDVCPLCISAWALIARWLSNCQPSTLIAAMPLRLSDVLSNTFCLCACLSLLSVSRSLGLSLCTYLFVHRAVSSVPSSPLVLPASRARSLALSTWLFLLSIDCLFFPIASPCSPNPRTLALSLSLSTLLYPFFCLSVVLSVLRLPCH